MLSLPKTFVLWAERIHPTIRDCRADDEPRSGRGQSTSEVHRQSGANEARRAEQRRAEAEAVRERRTPLEDRLRRVLGSRSRCSAKVCR